MNILKSIESKRKELCILKSTISNDMGISGVTYWHIMKGDQEIRFSELKKIAHIFECNIDLKIIDGVEELTLTNKY